MSIQGEKALTSHEIFIKNADSYFKEMRGEKSNETLINDLYCIKNYIENNEFGIAQMSLLILIHQIATKYSDGSNKDFFSACQDIMISKNNDYTLDDPFDNFRLCEKLGVDLPTGILVRCCDKVSRLISLEKKEQKVMDESIQNTATDLVNYLLILILYLEC